jgi:hypothetical protein
MAISTKTYNVLIDVCETGTNDQHGTGMYIREETYLDRNVHSEQSSLHPSPWR